MIDRYPFIHSFFIKHVPLPRGSTRIEEVLTFKVKATFSQCFKWNLCWNPIWNADTRNFLPWGNIVLLPCLSLSQYLTQNSGSGLQHLHILILSSTEASTIAEEVLLDICQDQGPHFLLRHLVLRTNPKFPLVLAGSSGKTWYKLPLCPQARSLKVSWKAFSKASPDNIFSETLPSFKVHHDLPLPGPPHRSLLSSHAPFTDPWPHASW